MNIGFVIKWDCHTVLLGQSACLTQTGFSQVPMQWSVGLPSQIGWVSCHVFDRTPHRNFVTCCSITCYGSAVCLLHRTETALCKCLINNAIWRVCAVCGLFRLFVHIAISPLVSIVFLSEKRYISFGETGSFFRRNRACLSEKNHSLSQCGIPADALYGLRRVAELHKLSVGVSLRVG